MFVFDVASLRRQWYILDELINFSHDFQKFLDRYYKSLIDSVQGNSYNKAAEITLAAGCTLFYKKESEEIL